MDDVVINVRQIAQYPLRTPVAAASDLLLLQGGGLGGPYFSGAAATLVATALQSGSGPAMGVGVIPPADAAYWQVLSGTYVIDGDGSLAWNLYDSTSGWRYLNNGPAANIWLDPAAGIRFDLGPAGVAGSPAATTPYMLLSPAGDLALAAGTLTVARDPAAAQEVATLQWVQDQIAAFYAAGNLTIPGNVTAGGDGSIGGNLEVAGTGSFAGTLTAADPQAATNVVTLRYLDEALESYAPLASPAFTGAPTAPTVADAADASAALATTAWVQTALQSGLAGYSPLQVGIAPGNTEQLWFDSAGAQLYVWDGQRWIIANNTPNPALANVGLLAPAPSARGQLWFDENTAQLYLWNGVAWVIAVNQPWPLFPPIDSPHFTGTPKVPTAPAGDSSLQIANTQWVMETLHNPGAWLGNIYAPIYSPMFTGMPTAPTPPPGSNDAKIATTAFVMAAITSYTAGVVSFEGRSGHVTLQTADLTNHGLAFLHSPNFTGDPHAPTPLAGDDSERIATTEWVQHALRTQAVQSFNGRVGHVALVLQDIIAADGAPIHSPHFEGSPSAPTRTQSDASDHLATTEFVHQAVKRVADDLEQLEKRDTVRTFNQRHGHVVLNRNDIVAAGGAPSRDPTLTGIPHAPTAVYPTNTTQIATTAYVTAAVKAIPSGPPGVPGAVGPAGPPGPIGPPGTAKIYANPTPPMGAGLGELWYNTTLDEIFFWGGASWKSLQGDFLKLTGGTLTGALHLPATTPTVATQAATKAYVDLHLPLAGGTLAGNLILHASPTAASNILQAATKGYVDAVEGRFADHLPLTGGTMTGMLTLSGPPTAALHPVNLQYLQNGYVALAGSTMTGALLLHDDPIAALGAVTKQYADAIGTSAGNRVLRAGDTMTGPLILHADPVNLLGAATRQYTDTKLALKGGTMQTITDTIGTDGTGIRLRNAINAQVVTNDAPAIYIETLAQGSWPNYSASGIVISAQNDPNDLVFWTNGRMEAANAGFSYLATNKADLSGFTTAQNMIAGTGTGGGYAVPLRMEYYHAYPILPPEANECHLRMAFYGYGWRPDTGLSFTADEWLIGVRSDHRFGISMAYQLDVNRGATVGAVPLRPELDCITVDRDRNVYFPGLSAAAITLGAPDSGGAGFRCLRVPN